VRCAYGAAPGLTPPVSPFLFAKINRKIAANMRIILAIYFWGSFGGVLGEFRGSSEEVGGFFRMVGNGRQWSAII
jgi:hypothetical protein